MHGLVKRLMVLSIATILINTLGNYIVLFQPFGLPSYGVQGVSIATVVSRIGWAYHRSVHAAQGLKRTFSLTGDAYFTDYEI